MLDTKCHREKGCKRMHCYYCKRHISISETGTCKKCKQFEGKVKFALLYEGWKAPIKPKQRGG